MESFHTEEQQVEAIKSFWGEHGTSIIAGIVIGLGGYVGWGTYQDSVKAGEERVSASYQTLIESQDIQATEFAGKGKAFVEANKDTAYASLTGFALAKEAVDTGDYELAATELKQVMASAPSEELKTTAALRLARVQVQLTQYEQALSTLEQVTLGSFTAIAEEVKGDAYRFLGKDTQARAAYQAAIDAGGLAANPLLQTKVDDLKVASEG